MEKTRKNLHIFSEVLFVFAKIGFIASIVGVSLAALAMLSLAITGGTSFTFSLAENVTMNLLLVKVNEGENLAMVWGNLAYALTSCAFLISVMRILMRLFANMRDNYTPFTMENAGLFKKMAIWMIVNLIVPATVGQIVGNSCAKVMQLSFQAEYSDGFSLIVVLILFVMSIVFRYGCELQEQADTTL